MTADSPYSLRSKGHRPHPVLRVVVPIVLITVAVSGAVWMVKTSPKPAPRPPGERAAVVTVTHLVRSSVRVVVDTTGTVVPSRSVTLTPRVSGPIVWVDPRFVPGGRFRAGETVVKIDPVDYGLAVTNRWVGLVKAEYDGEVEQGMQDLAAYEWQAVTTNAPAGAYTEQDRSLALREPHLRLVRGNLASARALLESARLDLERTAVSAPFNAVVQARQADLGAQVSPQTALAELVGTDAYWVRVALPAGHLHWVRAADEGGQGGAPVTVSPVPGTESDATWRGTVLRKLPDLEPGGRQAQLIVEVERPEQPATGSGALLLGAYVRVRIEGPVLENVIAIPRTALREGDGVWVVRADGRLEVRPVKVLWSSRDRAVVGEGLAEGETVVLSELAVPVTGMLLQVQPAAPAVGEGR
ncbi:MAG: efflux RND transporter periplasmic adaptor subunit [Verrucomicrobia bacterium]|nr:efflux RND transporter periplasmic adaptor subunit [Verrucomicrobiota bacterium]